MRETCFCTTVHYKSESHVPIGTRRLMRDGTPARVAISAARGVAK